MQHPKPPADQFAYQPGQVDRVPGVLKTISPSMTRPATPEQGDPMQRWNTLALPDVAWPQRRSLPARFRHLHTTVEPVEDKVAQEIGYTAWQSVDGGHPVRLGWDWALIDGGVVVVANPMSIHSNLRFTDDSGGPLMECRAVVQLHAIVHALP